MKQASIEQERTICVVQMTRIGDLIQTYQAVTSLKEQRPDIRVILVARSSFAKPLNFLLKKCFDEIYTFSVEDFFNPKEGPDLRKTKKNLTRFLEPIQKENINVLINFSWSKSSSYLCSLIKSEHKLGLKYDENCNLEITDRWSNFVYSNIMGGRLCPFSLVDIYKGMLGTEFEKCVPAVPYLESNHSNIITIHPFASAEHKMWPPSKWIEIIYQILKSFEDIEIYLVGSKDEKVLANEFDHSPVLKKYSKRIKNHVGETNIEQVHEILRSSLLFIGHDSMVGHLSSVANILAVTVSLGKVRPFETTPYGSKNINIFSANGDQDLGRDGAKREIPFQIVSSCINQLITTKILDPKKVIETSSIFHHQGVKIYQTEFTDKNWLYLNEVFHKNSLMDVFRLLYRIIWFYYIEDKSEFFAVPEISNEMKNSLRGYSKGIEQLFDLCEFGKKYSKYIIEEISSDSPDLDKIKEFSAKIEEIDKLQLYVKRNFEYLAPLIDYFNVEKANLGGQELIQIATNSFFLFENFSNLTSALYELVSGIIDDKKEVQENNI